MGVLCCKDCCSDKIHCTIFKNLTLQSVASCQKEARKGCTLVSSVPSTKEGSIRVLVTHKLLPLLGDTH